ncbi:MULTISPECIES: VOC family protein [Mycolicibacter]|uniref:Glyoxalase n=1 Tax=Mycolicibacter kumamotonensis TaxID=354243 RepID=A0A7K3L6I8_9MYCO|nr:MULTISPECIES: VOC family protein [Mycolicibacter]NDJ87907.1 glyoxalase [Mycolicibacter kumamotonensis]RAV03996.1 glyoxalase [Mycolicibacter senuensis]
MALQGLELHHHAVRMNPDAAEKSLRFYRDVLGLQPDPAARDIPGVPLYWMDTANGTQIHLFGVEGVSQYARSPENDPFVEHVAFGVPDIVAARAELDRLEVSYWRAGRDESQQLFLYDDSGNMVELHQIGTCRCDRTARTDT